MLSQPPAQTLLGPVAVVGAGGLGCPVALALVEAGVAVRLIDADRVERSNLQRQVLYGEGDIGRLKVEAARDRLLATSPEAAVAIHATHLKGWDGAEDLLSGCPVAIDATDDPEVRFLLNRWALEGHGWAVIGGIQHFTGLIVTVGPGFGPCFRCLFDPAEVTGAEGCGAIGVIGAIAGVVGHLQAELALDILAGRGARHVGAMIEVDAIAGRIRQRLLPEAPDCPACGGGAAVVDLRADRCPFTWVKTRLYLEALEEGAVLDLHMRRGEAETNIPRNLRAEGHHILCSGPSSTTDFRVLARKNAQDAASGASPPLKA